MEFPVCKTRNKIKWDQKNFGKKGKGMRGGLANGIEIWLMDQG